ncbi:MAG: UDP-N-acetylmuramoyl-tripeptide--D-alanyl-D-alanine ligase, partial [Planctomycetota bacterium]
MNTIDELCNAIGGQWSGGGAATAQLGPVVIDSRRAEPGVVFWALRGPNHDGNDFVDEAFRRGALGVVVNKTVRVPDGRWAVRV